MLCWKFFQEETYDGGDKHVPRIGQAKMQDG